MQLIVPNCEFVVLEGMPHAITDTASDRCTKEFLRFRNVHRSV